MNDLSMEQMFDAAERAMTDAECACLRLAATRDVKECLPKFDDALQQSRHWLRRIRAAVRQRENR